MSGWASKLANTPPSNTKKKQQPQQFQSSVKKNKDEGSASGSHGNVNAINQSNFNSTEIIEYLHRNFQKNLANSNTSNDTLVYKSLESNSQWKTKSVVNKKASNTKYNPKAVIRQEHKSNSLDLLFELNRSVYQQQQQQQQQTSQQQPHSQQAQPQAQGQRYKGN
ncbi:hypothetical protein CLIB1423_15S02432 [[Candida] railenensis]|uniref:Uncharacterized protein n=1 Tax=[Candida] railenensis TaxID=45579 RepID=A0A9P0W073_9ASCO|nr:hypothetical protein CLIB1423_15S02432 [[Candida] railenensis]